MHYNVHNLKDQEEGAENAVNQVEAVKIFYMHKQALIGWSIFCEVLNKGSCIVRLVTIKRWT